MGHLFYSKLAVNNLRKNSSSYFPYILSCSSIVGLFYILHTISVSILNSDFEGAGSMGIILFLSTIIAGIISVLIVFYTNSFLMKRRKKELGLYSVLGMEKNHIARVLFCEMVFTGLFSIAAGILSGIVLTRLLILLLLNLVKIPSGLNYSVSISSILTTVLLFGLSFLAVMLYNYCTIRLSNPISLIHGSKQGEREPKTKKIMTLLGVLTLGSGYFLALNVKTPSDAISAFFFAVLLVIAGTYLLFTSGSIALLKAAKKNRRFYYKPENFISVSGMIYRMKQNAVGLANICILSTCVLVVLSSTVCLYAGEEDSLKNVYPHDVLVRCEPSEGADLTTAKLVRRHAQDNGVQISDVTGYHKLLFAAKINGNQISVNEMDEGVYGTIALVPWEDFSLNGGKGEQPSKNQVLFYSSSNSIPDDALQIGGMEFQIAGRLDQETLVQALSPQQAAVSITNDMFLIVPDLETIRQLKSALFADADEDYSSFYYHYDFNLEGEDDAVRAFCTTLRETLYTELDQVAPVKDIFSSRQSFYSLYGTLMFIGLFFVALFLIATVLIIYYKQISEGYEDHGRFRIMQEVGLSHAEVKQTIRKQIMLVFFLPLAVAVLHIAVAFPVLCKLLVIFNMSNRLLFFFCTAGSVLLFAVFYLIIYRVTAKTYYKLVQR